MPTLTQAARWEPITLDSIHEDNGSVLWPGTQANGAWRFNGTAFEKFRPRAPGGMIARDVADLLPA